MLLQVIDTVSVGTYTTTSSKDLPMLSLLACGHSQHCKSIIYLVLFTVLIVGLVVPGYLRLYNIIVSQKTMVFRCSTHEKLVISEINHFCIFSYSSAENPSRDHQIIAFKNGLLMRSTV